MNERVIELRQLSKQFPVRRAIGAPGGPRALKAVDALSFAVHAAETVGIVGESGCGKTTTSRMILRLETPTSGEVLFLGQPIHALQGDALRGYRSAVQAVFQDPYGSLSPRLRIRDIIDEPMAAIGLPRAERNARARELMDRVGLPVDALSRYPHEFSGGQRQRIAIARALSTRPRLIVLDEPVSALDLSVRAQIMNLLLELQREMGVSFLLIAHDLGVVRHMSDIICVMYLGSVMEIGPSDEVYDRPRHPYTRALLDAELPKAPRPREAATLPGDLPSPLDPPSGCKFRTRCPHAMPVCAERVPAFRGVGDAGHAVACHLVDGDDMEGRA